jgi:hypothetical protein
MFNTTLFDVSLLILLQVNRIQNNVRENMEKCPSLELQEPNPIRPML